MTIFDKVKNRYNIILFVLVLLIAALSFKLAFLTIAQGDYYRDLSDNKRVKEVYTTAPRGEIRDRHGRLLAGNKPSFTVQLFKDEVNLYEQEEKNQAFLRVSRLLEEDGAEQLDEFPIEFNVFAYKDQSSYQEEGITANEKVVGIIHDNQLIGDLLKIVYQSSEYKDHFSFIAVNKAIKALNHKGIEVPVESSIVDGQLELSYAKDKAIEDWLEDYELGANLGPMQAITSLIDNDKTIIRKTLDHALVRKEVYKLLSDQGLIDNIIMKDYAYSYQEDYINQKSMLSSTYPQVTEKSPAMEDFVNIFIASSLENFLGKTYIIDEGTRDEQLINPGQILKDRIKEKGLDLPVEIKLDSESEIVAYEYTGKEDLGESTALDLLIEAAKEDKLLEKFIVDDQIKGLAQKQLIEDGVNPRISIGENFQYVAINNLNNFLESYKIDEEATAEEAFNQIVERHEIDESFSHYEKRGMINLYNQIRKQGYLAYEPINIAYGITEKTVARIEEGLMEFSGVDISIEPVRYYPQGESAAHILGYLGKISQANEIETYIEEKGYSRGAIIGKTGVEEYFEDSLAGQTGVKTIEVDSVGNTTATIEETKPVAGDNLYLSIDLNLQEKAEEALEKTLREIQRGGTYTSPWGNYAFSTSRSKRRPYVNATSGAVVAIDVKTGQLLASASYPAYDPNLFSTGITASDWQSLFPENEKDLMAPRPLYNIATQTALQPGSTFKMATALTALEKGLSPYAGIRDMGYINVGDTTMNCLLWTTSRRTHGRVDVYEAIRDSCNYYFYSLALGRNQRTGESLGTRIDIEDIMEMSKKLGLDDKTGLEINIPAEASGGVPDPEKKLATDKALLQRTLERDIDYYFEDDFEYDDQYRQEVIDKILSWMDMEEAPTRGEVYHSLMDMHLVPDRKMGNNRNGIVDIIKYDFLKAAGWTISDTLNITIGQGRSSYTPIQMANYVGIIANGGYKNKLSLVDNIKNHNNSETLYMHQTTGERIEMNNYENLEHIKKGMLRVSEAGTARAVFANFPIKVGSKTGTAQRAGRNPVTGQEYDDFTWFVAFAPYDDPEIAVATLIFQGGSGGHGAPLVRDVIGEYLGLNKTEKEDRLPYQNVIKE